MYFGLIIVILIQLFSLIYCQVHFPDIPCPKILKYVYDGTKWIVEITLPTPDVNKVVLKANFTVPESNVNGIGKLFLNNKNAIDDLTNKRPLIYTYVLKESIHIPQVTGITYNGNVVCVGPEISKSPFTMFRLTNTLLIPELNYTNTYENDLNCGVVRNKRKVNNNDTDVVHFIYHGTVIARNKHPWLAALYETDKGPLTFFCAGNLISNKHILSAAHCTLNKKNIKVKVGAHNTNDFFENGAIIRNVEKIINHREYRHGNGNADISILILSNTVGFTEFVKPICLWNNEDDINSIIGDQGTIMGWGLTENGKPSSTPLQTDTTIVSQQQCQSVDILKDAISNTTFCAGTRGTGPCIGDSGGGLLLKRQGKWYIRGIISISVGSRRLNICDVNTYAVYVDTAKYRTWIIDNIK